MEDHRLAEGWGVMVEASKEGRDVARAVQSWGLREDKVQEADELLKLWKATADLPCRGDTGRSERRPPAG